MKTRRVSETSGSNTFNETEGSQDPTYSCTLSTGKTVTFRGMIASDLIFMEKQGLKGKTDSERSISLMERMSVSPNDITNPELQRLSIKDFRKLSDLLSDAGGVDDLEEDDDSFEGEE